ncbi:MAG: LytTR family DNA-binding domain-containing protein, partial [Clostridia bacterium]|nr:LytTR family DNA-binding domain-containing protein [Clostridia bacterium]
SKEFAIDSYAVDAYYYLLKPVKEEALFPLIDKIMLERKARNQVCVIYTPMGIVNIPFAKIECLEVYNKHLVFHLSDGSNKEIRGSMSDYEEAFLSRTEFKKIHRSYILNMDYISSIEPTTIKTYSGKEFPVSRLLVRDIKDQYMNYMFAKD